MTIGDAKVAHHHRSVLPAQDRALAQGACEPGARLPDRMLSQSARRTRSISPPPWRRRPESFETVRTSPKTWRCCTSPAAPPAGRRARCTCTKPSSPITSPASSRSTCIPTTSSGARPIPGWVTGTSYGIISPLTNGVTMIVDQAEFDAERWYRILQDQKVTVWYTAPTAIRMLMKVGADIRQAVRPVEAALHGERRRAAQSGGRRLGRRGVRQAVPRQLVADRNRRHHDRQLSRRWT